MNNDVAAAVFDCYLELLLARPSWLTKARCCLALEKWTNGGQQWVICPNLYQNQLSSLVRMASCYTPKRMVIVTSLAFCTRYVLYNLTIYFVMKLHKLKWRRIQYAGRSLPAVKAWRRLTEARLDDAGWHGSVHLLMPLRGLRDWPCGRSLTNVAALTAPRCVCARGERLLHGSLEVALAAIEGALGAPAGAILPEISTEGVRQAIASWRNRRSPPESASPASSSTIHGNSLSCTLGNSFTTAELHPRSVDALGCSADRYTFASLRCDLSRLRAKGLVEKLPRSRRIRLLPNGYSICLVFLKLFERVYAPLTAGLLSPVKPDARLRSQHRSQLDQNVVPLERLALLRDPVADRFVVCEPSRPENGVV
jgi:hypothetical protein